MKFLLLFAILSFACHPLLGDEQSTQATESKSVQQQLRERVASLEKRLAALEAVVKSGLAASVSQQVNSLPIQSTPPTAYPRPASPPAVPHASHPWESKVQQYRDALPDDSVQPPIDKRSPANPPPNSWNRIEINGQYFYIVPVASMPN